MNITLLKTVRLLTRHRREEYTDENSEGRGEIDLDLVKARSR